MPPAPRPVPWRAVAIFYAVALLVAAPFNLGLASGWLAARVPGTPLALWPFLPAALGPALGAALARRVRPSAPVATTLFGTSRARSLVAAAAPVAAFSFLGARAALLALVAVVYATGEELGWRGFLADALAPLPAAGRVLLTAAFWWLWHLRFGSPFELLAFPVLVLLASAALDHAAQTTGSVLVPGAMHALVTLLSASGAPSRPMALAGGATLAAWVLLGTFWPHPRPVRLSSPAEHA